jgi:hypothetical protein
MRAARAIPVIGATVCAIVGILAVSGRADKPGSPPGLSKPEGEPVLVSVTGGIAGKGNPCEISVTFADESFSALLNPRPLAV